MMYSTAITLEPFFYYPGMTWSPRKTKQNGGKYGKRKWRNERGLAHEHEDTLTELVEKPAVSGVSNSAGHCPGLGSLDLPKPLPKGRRSLTINAQAVILSEAGSWWDQTWQA